MLPASSPGTILVLFHDSIKGPDLYSLIKWPDSLFQQLIVPHDSPNLSSFRCLIICTYKYIHARQHIEWPDQFKSSKSVTNLTTIYKRAEQKSILE